MGRGKQTKIQVSRKPPSKGLIVEPKIDEDSTQFVISYKYTDLGSKKYSFNNISDNKEKISYYNNYINKLNEYSQYKNFKEHITSNRSYAKINHIHPIDWKDSRIREDNFSCLNSELMEQVKDDCWQLGINNKFRIHGFFIENVFYIIWFDTNHNLYIENKHR